MLSHSNKISGYREEVIGLKVKDICFDKDYILIEDSKNHKSRIVPQASFSGQKPS